VVSATITPTFTMALAQSLAGIAGDIDMDLQFQLVCGDATPGYESGTPMLDVDNSALTAYTQGLSADLNIASSPSAGLLTFGYHTKYSGFSIGINNFNTSDITMTCTDCLPITTMDRMVNTAFDQIPAFSFKMYPTFVVPNLPGYGLPPLLFMSDSRTWRSGKYISFQFEESFSVSPTQADLPDHGLSDMCSNGNPLQQTLSQMWGSVGLQADAATIKPTMLTALMNDNAENDPRICMAATAD
jgi:hypothetical protein